MGFGFLTQNSIGAFLIEADYLITKCNDHSAGVWLCDSMLLTLDYTGFHNTESF